MGQGVCVGVGDVVGTVVGVGRRKRLRLRLIPGPILDRRAWRGEVRCACFVVPQRRYVNIHNIVHRAGERRMGV